ncbi:nucleoside triphosphate hydrolase [Pseudoalteromonas sp. NBT06-2]|uniref:YcjX family protein n=1 Tax=Pseudoalteromonas sp. NBT06-2 TaxID=2025950 RepID=UPI000BA5155C|nr:YcjX family protein [Pseudoalteromonas sp. NBT06-2]PAJ73152.1 nucleoside triphosphate hydrolase [Pseudoalteromonas sp. NBT06-2]
MLDKLLNAVSSSINSQLNSTNAKKIKHQAHQLLHRSLDQHITLAVTGFSRSGKTAFITALVEQLTKSADKENLPFFDVIQSERLIAAKSVPQDALALPTFPYKHALSSLKGEFPNWPDSTKRINTLRLALKYKPNSGIRSQITDTSTLIIDLIDYPGEWLMDLPMLSLNFEQWCQQQFELLKQNPRAEYSQELLEKLATLDLDAPVDESKLAEIAQMYKALLQRFKKDSKLTILQPGRMLIPGDLDGAPLLMFFPINFNEREKIVEGSNLAHLKKRYQAYIKEVVTPFYENYFCRFDRQIILVDLLTALTQGANVLAEQGRAIEQLIAHFNYGQSSFIKRLFSPKIDKLLFAANKSDHLSTEHHKDLAILLNSIVQQAKNELKFDGVQVETMAMSSICATKVVEVKDKSGKAIKCIYGKEMQSGQWITYLPAQPPMRVLSQHEWPKEGFSFPEFYPQLTFDNNLRHIRLDHVCEFLLGDKLK